MTSTKITLLIEKPCMLFMGDPQDSDRVSVQSNFVPLGVQFIEICEF